MNDLLKKTLYIINTEYIKFIDEFMMKKNKNKETICKSNSIISIWKLAYESKIFI